MIQFNIGVHDKTEIISHFERASKVTFTPELFCPLLMNPGAFSAVVCFFEAGLKGYSNSSSDQTSNSGPPGNGGLGSFPNKTWCASFEV